MRIVFANGNTVFFNQYQSSYQYLPILVGQRLQKVLRASRSLTAVQSSNIKSLAFHISFE